MTTMAALLQRASADAGERRRFGTAQAARRSPWSAGLLLSQVLTLYTTPVIYLYLDRLQQVLTPARKKRMPRLANKMSGQPAAAE